MLDTHNPVTRRPGPPRSKPQAITKQDGEGMARTILNMSDGDTCADPAAFVADMRALFDGLDMDTIKYHTSEVRACTCAVSARIM